MSWYRYAMARRELRVACSPKSKLLASNECTVDPRKHYRQRLSPTKPLSTIYTSWTARDNTLRIGGRNSQDDSTQGGFAELCALRWPEVVFGRPLNFPQSLINCIDNSGAAVVECVKVLKMKRHAKIGQSFQQQPPPMLD